MANNDTLQQLEEWKDKYYHSITELEQQQQYDELLQRSLGRLALAAQGLDSDLDKQLKSLRKLLRGKSDHSEIKNILELMENAIAKMETQKIDVKEESPGEILAQLLVDLKLSKPFKSEAKILTKKLKSAPNSDIQYLTPDLLRLIQAAIEAASAKNTKTKRSFHLFGLGKKAEEEESQAPEFVSNSNDEQDDDETQPHLILMQLLERLSLPTDLSKQATKIRLKIEQGIEAEDLPEVIASIADIISSLGSKVISDKVEYETFLKTLTERLSELDQHLRQTTNEEIKSFEQRSKINKEVESEVNDLREQVEDANDLEVLKVNVTQHLDTLNQHFEKYRQSDVERLKKSQQHITELNERIKVIEEESVTLKQAAEQARSIALKDALTGIWNRQAIDETMEKEYTRWLRYQSPLSIVIWDVDFFKRVNDNYGHAAGDKVLKTIAQIFSQATRDADFIGRFGGEEFMGIFPETRLEEALSLANKIREKVAGSKFHYESKPVPITASAGLATFRPNDTINDVFKRADKALYQAKESGRNMCIAEDKS